MSKRTETKRLRDLGYIFANDSKTMNQVLYNRIARAVGKTCGMVTPPQMVQAIAEALDMSREMVIQWRMDAYYSTRFPTKLSVGMFTKVRTFVNSTIEG